MSRDALLRLNVPHVQLLPEAPYRRDRRKAEVLLEKTHIVDSLVLLCFAFHSHYTAFALSSKYVCLD